MLVGIDPGCFSILIIILFLFTQIASPDRTVPGHLFGCGAQKGPDRRQEWRFRFQIPDFIVPGAA
jgi:hypothetical protein